MKITVCDFCKNNKSIYYHDDEDDVDACEKCYFESDYYEPTPLEEKHGIKVARQVKDLDGFLVLDYESIQYYDKDSKKIANELNIIFKNLNIPLEAIGRHTEDNCIIGFKKSWTH